MKEGIRVCRAVDQLLSSDKKLANNKFVVYRVYLFYSRYYIRVQRSCGDMWHAPPSYLSRYSLFVFPSSKTYVLILYDIIVPNFPSSFLPLSSYVVVGDGDEFFFFIYSYAFQNKLNSLIAVNFEKTKRAHI